MVYPPEWSDEETALRRSLALTKAAEQDTQDTSLLKRIREVTLGKMLRSPDTADWKLVPSVYKHRSGIAVSVAVSELGYDSEDALHLACIQDAELRKLKHKRHYEGSLADMERDPAYQALTAVHQQEWGRMQAERELAMDHLVTVNMQIRELETVWQQEWDAVKQAQAQVYAEEWQRQFAPVPPAPQRVRRKMPTGRKVRRIILLALLVFHFTPYGHWWSNEYGWRMTSFWLVTGYFMTLEFHFQMRRFLYGTRPTNSR